MRVRVRESGPGPEPEPEHLNLIPDGRDLGPENDFITAASFPASGLPLSWSLGRADHPWSAAVERGRSTLPQDNRMRCHRIPTPPATCHPGLPPGTRNGCIHLCTFAQAAGRFAPLHTRAGPPVLRPSLTALREAYFAAGISFNVYHPSLCHRVSPAFDLISPRARWWTLPRTRPSTMRRTLSPSAETVADLMVGVV